MYDRATLNRVVTPIFGAERMARAKLFISYSHKDSRWLERVQEQLAVLASEGLIDSFDDTQIGAGENWYARLDQAMLEAQLALLLISAPFLTSDFIRKDEIPRLFGAHQAAGMRIFPLLIRDCPWEEVHWLQELKLQMRPRPLRPVATIPASQRDKALADVAREIAGIVRGGSGVAHVPPPAETADADTRLSVPGPLAGIEFSDPEVNNVVMELQKKHRRSGKEELDGPELIPELDLLFNRKTFRFEEIRGCPEQRWADRLDSAYQVLKVLRAYMRSIRDNVPDAYRIYQELIKQVDVYCMQMGALLFEPAVDYNAVEQYIGARAFRDHLPGAKQFPVRPNKLPIIEDEINDSIEPHRLRAVQLMDQLAGRLSGS